MNIDVNALIEKMKTRHLLDEQQIPLFLLLLEESVFESKPEEPIAESEA
jgi:hypothetical protein